MQVDLYLRWTLYLELIALFIVFIPILTTFKRSVLLTIAPLFSSIQLVFWIFWSFIGFIFVTTVKDAYFNDTTKDPTTLDAAARLELVRNERDAMMSFITLLLLPIIHLHGKSVLKTYKLEQSVTAMTKQATNASQQLLAMLDQEKANDQKQKKKETEKKKNNGGELTQNDELELFKARYAKMEKKYKDLEFELKQSQEQLSMFKNVAKKLKKKA